MVPINSPSDMRALSALGAKEFYCGFSPVDASTVVNRQDAYLRDKDEAAVLIESAKKSGSKVFFTLNMYYKPEILALVLAQLEEVAELGSFGLIVSDVSLMKHLKDRFPDILLVASVLGHSLNSRAVNFYKEAGCDRVILGTHLNTDELNEIVSDWSPEVKLEILILNSGCFYEDGFCSFEHRFVETLDRDSTVKSFLHRASMTLLDRGPRAARRAFYTLGPDYNPCCLRKGEIEIRNTSGTRLPDLEDAALSFLSMERFKHKCGLCTLFRLEKSGLAAVKIVGREKTLGEKKRDFLMVRKAVDFLHLASDEEEFKRYCHRLFVERNGFDCHRLFCYYSL